VYGRADTDNLDGSGSTLHSSASPTATTLSVASSNSLWTVSSADFPFDVNIDGERITVTNITGSGSPQSFTVTRSVNGVVKSHSAGADVRLFIPPVYAVA